MKPILFNTEMVKAILDRRKSVTRRVVKPQPPVTSHVQCTDGNFSWTFWEDGDKHWIKSPYNPGDVLYVRETWCKNLNPNSEAFGEYEYRADYDGAMCQDFISWHPSIHMP